MFGLMMRRGLAALVTPPGIATAAAAQTVAPAAPAGRPNVSTSWHWTVNNMTRLESWSFFEPRPGGGDPESTFVGNRLRVGLTRSWPRVDFSAALQYVQFAGLPTHAVGPGAFGAGALYFDGSGSTTSHQVYPRVLSVRLKLPAGVTVDAGRFGYTSGAEAPSGEGKIEAVKAARLDSRLIGDFEWSLYQRSYDGARADVDRKPWHLTGTWLRPTQGGYKSAAGRSLGDVNVGAVTLTLRPGTLVPRTDVAPFVYRYDDSRDVAARPDNTGRPASRVDVGITTLGASAVGAAPIGSGEADWFGWFAGQTGDWYGQLQRAWSFSTEAGYQWKSARWQPWLRGGHLAASGDSNPADNRHGTFFLMIPTVRRYSYTTVYAPTNLEDTFAELVLRPSARATLRADVRRLALSDAADRWYSGSGATAAHGTFFGFAARPSTGFTDLGRVAEGSADVRLGPHWAVNGFLGSIEGGQVVKALFARSSLRYLYLENVIQF